MMAFAACSIDGCGRHVKARGWCKAHHNRWRQHGHPGRAEFSRRPLADASQGPAPTAPPGSCLLPLTQGMFAIVDKADYEALAQYNWHADRRSTLWYARRALPGTTRCEYLHRRLLPNARVVDHINGDGLDNRRANLRPASWTENVWNTRKSSRPTTSQYLGVSWHKATSTWRAQIVIEGKNVSLGYFRAAEDAARAWDAAALRARGAFARLNFPQEAA